MVNSQVFEVLEDMGITELRPPQKKVIESGLLDRSKNFLVSIPTASGKTLIGEMALINNLLDNEKVPNGSKGLFIVPLRALASEKYNEFRKKYSKYGLKVGLSSGDLDDKTEDLSGFDLIITTSEKLDSLMRHKVAWIDDVSVIVIDEIHLIGDKERGGTLEIILTKLKRMNVQILGLSATIGNPEELSGWLNAKLITDTWRPVDLKKGIFTDCEINYLNSDKKVVSKYYKEPTQNIVLDCINENGSCIIFCSSKKYAAGEAKKHNLLKKLTGSEIEDLNRISEEILEVLDTPTENCKELAECIKKGVAFHHAGLVSKQRSIIEEAYRNRIIKLICCTPTLSAGLNMPCRRVIIRDLYRYTESGYKEIPVMEIQQCIGRAGRPGLDPYGEGLIYLKKEQDHDLALKMLDGKPENMYSWISYEVILRKQILGLIATEYIQNESDLIEFMKNTYYYYLNKDNFRGILTQVYEILESLRSWRFISGFTATDLGERIAELYIDPLTAHDIITGITKLNMNARNLSDKEIEQHLLYILTNNSELKPFLPASDEEEYGYSEIIRKIKMTEGYPFEYVSKKPLEVFKTSQMYYNWINEMSMNELLEKYKIEAGNLNYKLENINWIAYSAKEINRFLGLKNDYLHDLLKNLDVRLKDGVKQELITLMEIKNVGRVRARKLYAADIKSIYDIRQNPEKVLKLLGGHGKNILDNLKVKYNGEGYLGTKKKVKQPTLDGFLKLKPKKD
ncbi:DEAD/DEAH box helicase [Methanococcus maripaludis]|uniref:ATP-dependent DNA helicase Hel308 n=1 Tax=Methanococcus maripaludis OS7 TaxID=637915 RepID=A0A2Z5PPG8_METMI|nr:DEAD/DEAH box helicase [Methanococcus maripaludis]BAP62924.1 putative ATP-dependent helicase [Methanococcus maripaludis OS7]